MDRNSVSMRMDLSGSGLDAMIEALRGVSESAQLDIIAGAVRTAARPIVEQAKNNAPIRTGALRKSLGVVVRKYPKTGRIVAIIGPRKIEYSAVQGKAKQWRDGMSREGKTIAPFRYAHLVEFGHRSAAATGISVATAKGTGRNSGNAKPFPARSYVRGQFFLTRAFLAGKEQALAAMQFGFERALARAAQKADRKISRVTEKWRAA